MGWRPGHPAWSPSSGHYLCETLCSYAVGFHQNEQAALGCRGLCCAGRAQLVSRCRHGYCMRRPGRAHYWLCLHLSALPGSAVLPVEPSDIQSRRWWSYELGKAAPPGLQVSQPPMRLMCGPAHGCPGSLYPPRLLSSPFLF